MDSNFTHSEFVFYERRPVDGNTAGVVSYTGLYFVLAIIALGGFFLYVDFGHLWPLAFSLAAMIAGVVLTWRIIEHDQRAFYERQGTRPPAPQPEKAEKAVEVWPHVERSNGNQIDAGKYRLTWEAWHALALALRECSWRLVRDNVRATKAFTKAEIDDWAGIVQEFQRIGFADVSRDITPTGREWFERFLDPPPPSAMVGVRPAANGGRRRAGEGGG